MGVIPSDKEKFLGDLDDRTKVIKPQDPSKVVALTASTTLTAADHAFKVITITAATGWALTLPAATGTGDVYKIFSLSDMSEGIGVIQVANATDTMTGGVTCRSDSSNAALFFDAAATAGADTITLNRTTTGGVEEGEWFVITDVASGIFHVEGYIVASGSEATPFSAAVA